MRGVKGVTQRMRQLMNNMTVRLSWGLVLATLSVLVLIASGIGLYALHHGAAIVQASNDVQTQQALFSAFAATIRWVLLGIVVMTIATVIVVIWGVTANVLRPLDRLVSHFERMAQGDLSQSITSPGNNEIGRLYSAMAHMQSALSQTVGTVRTSGTSIFER